jgi:nicotinamidase-related amidase
MKTAMLILDMLNQFSFPEAKQLRSHTEEAAKRIWQLKQRVKKKKIPVIYVNDNFGKWKFNSTQIFESCTGEKCLGRDIALLLEPQPDDYFILKPMHSAFYSTSLAVLLDQLKIQQLILTGIAGNVCVLFTAHDAHMRHFKLIIPKDCIASNTRADNEYALRQFKNVFDFKIAASSSLRF